MKMRTKDIPKIKSFRPIEFPDYKTMTLSNGIPVYFRHSDEYQVLKIEINFRAGRIQEFKQGVSRACAIQMREGTKELSSSKIALLVDYYGATLYTSGGMDFARVELYTLNKHLHKLLPVLLEILSIPAFPDSELKSYKQRNKHRLSIDLAKNDIVAYRTLTENLFGRKHPYGYNSDKNTIDHLNREDLIEHFDTFIAPGPVSIILAGKVDESTFSIIDTYLGQLNSNPAKQASFKSASPVLNPLTKIEGKQKFQSSIRMGRKLFDRSHPDYPGIYLLNTILGGFFGSRLMKNIREEKGLTYDIYSTIDMMGQDGYLMIGAEIDNSNVELTKSEIFKEMDFLLNKEISSEELNLVRNYVNGNLLNLANGPFNSIELLRLIAIYDQDVTFFNYFIQTIQTIQAEEIMKLAQKYLIKDAFTQVVVGN